MSAFDLIKVVKGKAKLQGDEAQNTLSSMAAGHGALRSNGLLATIFECDKNGKPTHIVSYWKLSEHHSEGEELPRGQSYALLPKYVYENLLAK